MNKSKYNEGVKLEIETTPTFRSQWKRAGLTEQDFARFSQEIKDFEERNEDASNTLGDIVEGTGGAIKYRFSSSEDPTGKRGAYRIIYFRFGRRIYSMVLLYSKSEKSSLTQGEKNVLRKMIQNIKKQRK